MEVDLKSKAYRKLGFDREETVQVVQKMNLLLANYHLFYQKLRNFHWNVQGHDFFDIHEKFEELYDMAIEQIDDVAERVRVFGHTPMSNLTEYLEHSEITESGTDVEADKMVSTILDDMRTLVSFMVEVDEEAAAIGDIGTIDMMNDFVKSMEKYHWMLTSFLNDK